MRAFPTAQLPVFRLSDDIDAKYSFVRNKFVVYSKVRPINREKKKEREAFYDGRKFYMIVITSSRRERDIMLELAFNV